MKTPIEEYLMERIAILEATLSYVISYEKNQLNESTGKYKFYEGVIDNAITEANEAENRYLLALANAESGESSNQTIQ